MKKRRILAVVLLFISFVVVSVALAKAGVSWGHVAWAVMWGALWYLIRTQEGR